MININAMDGFCVVWNVFDFGANAGSVKMNIVFCCVLFWLLVAVSCTFLWNPREIKIMVDILVQASIRIAESPGSDGGHTTSCEGLKILVPVLSPVVE